MTNIDEPIINALKYCIILFMYNTTLRIGGGGVLVYDYRETVRR